MLKPLSSSFLKFLTLMVAFVATIFVFESSARADTPDGQFRTVTLDAEGDKVTDGVAVEVGSGAGIDGLIKVYGSMYESSAGKPLTWEVIQARNSANTFPTCKVKGDGYRAGRTGDTTVWEGCPMEARSIALMAGFSGRVVIPMHSIETYAERQARLAELEACDASIDCLSKKIIALGGTPPTPVVAPAPMIDLDMDALQSANNALQKEVTDLSKEKTVLASEKKTLAAANLVLHSELDTSRGSLYGLFGLAMVMCVAGFAIGRTTARPKAIGTTTALAVVDSDEVTALNRRTTVRGRKGAVETEESKHVDRSVLQQELLRLREELKLKEAENTKVVADNARYRRLHEEREERGERPTSPMYSITGDKVVVQFNNGAHPSAPTQHGVTSSPVSHNGMSELQMLEKESAVFMERLHRSLAKGPNDHAERMLLAKPMDDLMTAIAAAKASYIPDLVKLPPINPPPRKQAGTEKLLPPEDEEKTREIRVDALRKEASLESSPDSLRRSRRTIPGTGERPVLVPQGAYDSSRAPYTGSFRDEVTYDESAGDRPTNDIISDRETVPHPDSVRAKAELKTKKADRRKDPIIRRLMQRQARLRNGNVDLQLALQEANAREEALLPNAERLSKLEELELHTVPSLRGKDAAHRFKIRSLEVEIAEAKQATVALQAKHDEHRSAWRTTWNDYLSHMHSVKERRQSAASDDAELRQMEAQLKQKRLAANRAFSVYAGVSLFQILGDLSGADAGHRPTSDAAPASLPRPPRAVPTSDASAVLGGGSTNHNFPPVPARLPTPAWGTPAVRDVVNHMNGSSSSGSCWTKEDLEKTYAIQQALAADSPAVLVVNRDTLATFSSFLQQPAALSADLLRGQNRDVIANLTETPQELQSVLQQAAQLGLQSLRSSFAKTLLPPSVQSPLADVQLPPAAPDEDEDSRGPSA